ncbi:hypothetical protein AWB75_07135 [Caballeronia catudaia]|uniref:Helix-turn-helix domain protein n=1 Tax=Caballeronia catudaia TaxID=1777136 RepID=A0A158DSL6_9BURK|nr:hypothetical protein [Caballeronia catudaia]SAK97612.1 hypothetical protein AWB75_07135 [Caballeronia catudaia]
MMPTHEESSTVPQGGALELAHKRLIELFELLRPRLQSDVQQELSSALSSILDDVLKPKPDAGEFFSVGDAAKLLFVSRPYVLTLLERGKLQLHHRTGNDRFVTDASLSAYHADQQAQVQAHLPSRAGEDWFQTPMCPTVLGVALQAYRSQRHQQ